MTLFDDIIDASIGTSDVVKFCNNEGVSFWRFPMVMLRMYDGDIHDICREGGGLSMQFIEYDESAPDLGAEEYRVYLNKLPRSELHPIAKPIDVVEGDHLYKIRQGIQLALALTEMDEEMYVAIADTMARCEDCCEVIYFTERTKWTFVKVKEDRLYADTHNFYDGHQLERYEAGAAAVRAAHDARERGEMLFLTE